MSCDRCYLYHQNARGARPRLRRAAREYCRGGLDVPTIGAFAAVFDSEGRMLLVRRAYGPKDW